jgi:predicted lysophospholipase L1 biosynthesis ABC-type transport system permease subunit
VGEGLRIAGLADEPWVIVGVVASARQTGFDQDYEHEIYVPYAQYPGGRMELSIRGDDPRALITPVRETLRSLDSRQLVEDIQTLEELVYGSTSRGRFYATLLALFATLSLVLVVSGIFGAIGYWVRSRSREIGVRLALGATPRRLTTTLVAEGVLIVSAGLAAGLLAALALSRYLTSELYGVTPTSPAVYATVAALVLTAGTLAALLPVRRYCSVDPRSVLTSL